MDFELTDEQKLLRDNARRFLEREVAPLVADCERRGAFPEELYPRLVEPGGPSGKLLSPIRGAHRRAKRQDQ